jgi:hypothetical protein
MRRIKVNSPKYGIKEVLIDDEDWNKVKQYTWHIHYHKNIDNFYVDSFYVDNETPAKLKKNKTISLHRLVMGVTDPKIFVDHINHETCDCRKENLRICTHAENQMNRRLNKNNKSGYNGVTEHKKSGKWRVRIAVNNKQQLLGYFDKSEEGTKEAALAYNKKAIELFGEFAHLNIIEEKQFTKKSSLYKYIGCFIYKLINKCSIESSAGRSTCLCKNIKIL